MLKFQSKLKQLLHLNNRVALRMNSTDVVPEETAANVNEDYLEDDDDLKIDVKTPSKTTQKVSLFTKDKGSQYSKSKGKVSYNRDSIFDNTEAIDVCTTNPAYGIHDLNKKLKLVKKVNSSNLFHRMLNNHPEILTDMKRDMSNQVGYQSNPYKLVNDAFKRMSAEFSTDKVRDLEDGFRQPDGDILQALELLLQSEQIAVPNLNENQLFKLIIDPENSPALPYFLTAKFNLALKFHLRQTSEALIDALVSFGPKRPELLNCLSLIEPSFKINFIKLKPLQQIIESSDDNQIVFASILPFFLNQFATPNSTFLNWYSEMISSLKTNFTDKKDLKLWEGWVAQSKSLIDQSELNGIQFALYDIATSCQTIEERSRAIIIFMTLMQNISDAETVKGLLTIFCLEFGTDVYTEIFSSQRNPKLVNFLKKNGISEENFDLKNGISKTLSDNFLQKKSIIKLLSLDTSFGFKEKPANKLQFSLITKRLLQTQICQAIHGMTIGEYMALKETKKAIPAVEFISNTNFEEYSNLLKNDEFVNTFSYLSSIYEVNKDISDPSQNPSVLKAAIRGRFFKGQLARALINKPPRMSIKRMFSTNNKLEENEQDEIVPQSEPTDAIKEETEQNTDPATATEETVSEVKAAEGQDASAPLDQTTQSVQGPVVLNFNTNSHKPTEDLLLSDLTFEELKIQWEKLLQIASSNLNYKLMLFNSLFKFRDFELFIEGPDFKDYASLKPSQKASLLLLKEPLIPKQSLIYNGKSRLGSMPIDLNKFNVIEDLQIIFQGEHLMKYLKNFENQMTRTQYFVLLNIHLNITPKPNEAFSDSLIKTCVNFRWPKTLIQTLYLLIQNKCLSEKNLQLGLESLARFRYMASEGIDIFINAIAFDKSLGQKIGFLNPILESMFDCGQAQEAFQRFEELKTALQGVKYQENASLSVVKNEELEVLFKSKMEEVKRELYSMMFHYSIKYKINAQASMLYSEMISTKSFKTVQDAMNMLRYSRRSQMDLNATIEYIKTEMKYEENSNIVFPSQYVTEWINVLTDGPFELSNNIQTMLRFFFGVKNKTKPTRENLDAILKFVLVHNNFKILNGFLDYMDKYRKTANKEFGSDALSVLLNTLSRCNVEEVRNLIVSKLDRIFSKEDSAKSQLLKESEMKEKMKAQTEMFNKVLESRLEKVNFSVYEFTNKVHPKARPNKDKRSFILKTMQESYLQEKARIDALSGPRTIPESEVSKQKKARAQRIRESEYQFAQESAEEGDLDDDGDEIKIDEPEKKKKEKMERADAPERGKSKETKKPAAIN